MSEQKCPRCGSGDLPSHAYVCGQCIAGLVTDLTAAADHLRHADDKRAKRRSRLWIGYTPPSAETPLPFDPRVRDVIVPARNALTTWARLTIEEHHCRDLPSPVDTARVEALRAELAGWESLTRRIAAGEVVVNGDARGIDSVVDTLREDIALATARCDLENLATVATWLADHADWIGGRPWAHEAADDAARIRDELDRLMDSPPEKVALGPCNRDLGSYRCPEVLSAPVGETVHRCPRCGWDHDVTERRQKLLRDADDLTVTVREAVRLLRVSGLDVDQRAAYACIRHFGISAVLTTRLPGIKRPVSVYRLGALRESVETMHSDPDARREVRRAMRGAA